LIYNFFNLRQRDKIQGHTLRMQQRNYCLQKFNFIRSRLLIGRLTRNNRNDIATNFLKVFQDAWSFPELSFFAIERLSERHSAGACEIDFRPVIPRTSCLRYRSSPAFGLFLGKYRASLRRMLYISSRYCRA